MEEKVEIVFDSGFKMLEEEHFSDGTLKKNVYLCNGETHEVEWNQRRIMVRDCWKKDGKILWECIKYDNGEIKSITNL